MSGLSAVCPSKITTTFINTNLNVSTFIKSDYSFDSVKWNTIQLDSAFPNVMKQRTDDTNYFTTTIDGYTVNLFSILSVVGKINSALRARYTTTDIPAGGYWVNKNPQVGEITGELANIYDNFKQGNNSNIPGKVNAKIISPMVLNDLNASSSLRYSVSIDFVKSLEYEYCYWAGMLRQLLTDIINADKRLVTADYTEDKKTELKRQLMNAASSVNQRLNDLTSIMTYISNQQNTELATIVTTTNSTINNLNAATTKMNNAITNISSKDGLLKLRSRMVEYNEEKNNYASTLLSLYGFANLVALGLLFYIYKS